MTTAAAVTIVGKYRLLRVLGQGAMGQVFLAEDPDIGRLVAVKMMLATGKEDEERFRHEARVVGALSHPHIVVLHDFGFHDGRPYLVMEYVPGLSLQAWLRDPRPLGAHLAVMEGLASALVHAHCREVLHRDLKPSNVQVTPEGACKLMDFGIARTGALLTATAQVVGTPGYMAPEVLEDAAYTHQADVYSAGVLLYEMMAGGNPFVGQTVASTLRNVLTLQLPPLHDLRPELPAALATAIMSCVERDPRRRPSDLRHFLEVVRACRAQEGVRAGEPIRPLPLDATRSLLDVPSTRRRRRARKWKGAGAAAVAALAVAGAVRYAQTRAPATDAPTSSAPVAASPAALAPSIAAPAATPPAAAAQKPLPSRLPRARPVASLPLEAPPAAPVAAAPEPIRAPAPSAAPAAMPAVSDAGAPPAAAHTPAPPPLLVSVAPRTVRRGATFRLELVGSGLRPDLSARVLRAGRAASGLGVVRQQIVSATLARLVLLVDEDAPLGSYSIALVDEEGQVTNSVGFEVIL